MFEKSHAIMSWTTKQQHNAVSHLKYWLFINKLTEFGRLEFSTVFASVTLTLTRWPSYTNLTRTPRRYTGCANINFLHQGLWKLSSDRQTDRQVTWGHFRSRDKDWRSHHSIHHVENPMLRANLSVTDPELWAIEIYIVGIHILTFSTPMTLTLTRWP